MSKNLELYTKVTGDVTGKKSQIEAKQVIEAFVKKGFISPKLDIVFSERDDSHMLITEKETMKISKSVAYNYLRKAYGGKVELKKMISLLPMNLLTYEPTKPKYYTNGLTDCYNTFQAPNLTRCLDKQKHDKIEIPEYIGILLNNIFPIKKEQTFFLHWLANAFQLNKNQNTIISFGKTEGTGKGVFMEYIIKYAFGSKNVANVGKDIVSSSHNGELEFKSFCLINELEDSSNDAIDKLKMWITDPTIEIRAKFKTPRDVDNIINFWIHSNRNEALQVSQSDRRLNFFRTSKKMIIDIVPYQELTGNLVSERDTFIEMLCTLNVDMSMIAKPIMNEAKEAIIDLQENVETTQYFNVNRNELQELYIRVDGSTQVSDPQMKQAIYNIFNKYGGVDAMFKQLEKEIVSKFVSVSLLVDLYILESGEFKLSPNKVGRLLTPIWGKTINKRFDGKLRGAKACLI